MNIEEALKGADYQIKMGEREKEVLFLREYGLTKNTHGKESTYEKEIPDEERGL